MKKLAFFALLLTGTIAHAGRSAATELLSIELPPIPGGQYISEFDVETFGVEMVAACRLPGDWVISVGNEGTLGEIKGKASVGVSTFSSQSEARRRLRSLVLVRLSAQSRFEGRALFGRYGRNLRTWTVRLPSSAFRHVRAARCPPPDAP